MGDTIKTVDGEVETRFPAKLLSVSSILTRQSMSCSSNGKTLDSKPSNVGSIPTLLAHTDVSQW